MAAKRITMEESTYNMMTVILLMKMLSKSVLAGNYEMICLKDTMLSANTIR
jgi:hypothetical protein